MFAKQRKRILNIIGILIMATAVILAFFSAEIDLIDSTIYDTNQNTVPNGITLHFFVILIILLASNACFFFAENNTIKIDNLFFSNNLFYLGYVIVSIFFSLSTGCTARIRHLREFMASIATAPEWYSASLVTPEIENSIYRKIDQLSSLSVLTWLFTILGIALIILLKNESILCQIKQYLRKFNTILFEEQKTASVISTEGTDQSAEPDLSEPITSQHKNTSPAPNTLATELSTKYSRLTVEKPATGSAPGSQLEKAGKSSGVGYIEELKELKKLRDEEILTQEEFEAKKRQLLDI